MKKITSGAQIYKSAMYRDGIYKLFQFNQSQIYIGYGEQMDLFFLKIVLDLPSLWIKPLAVFPCKDTSEGLKMRIIYWDKRCR
jgi:hypothetical protein